MAGAPAGPGPVALLLLTDGRFPSGGHAYSAGMEQAVYWGDVADLAGAEAFAAGRTATSSTVAAQVAAAAAVVATDAAPGEARLLLDALDGEVDARLASAAGREVSRQQGRRWLRTVRGVWPEVLAGAWSGDGSATDPLAGRHGWVVTGAVAGRLGLSAADAATVTLYELVGTPLWSAVRLLGLDPVAAASVVARLVAGEEPAARHAAVEAAARTVADLAGTGRTVDWSWVSWATAPLSDLASEAHLRREERLFAS
jgi:urease accessory protein